MKHRKFKVLRLLFIVFVCVSVFDAEGITKSKDGIQTIKILTVGNSFSENACTYLDQITGSVPNCEIEITKAYIGGCSLIKHVNLIKKCDEDASIKPYRGNFSLKDLLQKDQYDFITIQQVSTLSFKSESFQPYADELCDFIKEYNPKAKIIVHQTWAYAPDCSRLIKFGITRDEMHSGLFKNYNELAERYNTILLPTGSAFYNSYKKNKNIDLWTEKDRYHASKNGCYLGGCVWFGKLFGISPVKIDFVPDGIDKKTAKFLRRIAAKELYKLK